MVISKGTAASTKEFPSREIGHFLGRRWPQTTHAEGFISSRERVNGAKKCFTRIPLNDDDDAFNWDLKQQSSAVTVHG
jgi:hypothetical protein